MNIHQALHICKLQNLKEWSLQDLVVPDGSQQAAEENTTGVPLRKKCTCASVVGNAASKLVLQ
jgi:hypothetical protein